MNKTFKKDSWLYRLIEREYYEEDLEEGISSCEIVWLLIKKVFQEVGSGCVLLGLTILCLFILCSIVMSIIYIFTPWIPFLGAEIFAMLGFVFTSVTITVFCIFCLTEYETILPTWLVKSQDTNKEPSAVVVLWKTLVNKVCIKIKFED